MGTVGVGGAFTCGFDALDTTSIRKWFRTRLFIVTNYQITVFLVKEGLGPIFCYMVGLYTMGKNG